MLTFKVNDKCGKNADTERINNIFPDNVGFSAKIANLAVSS